MAESAKTKESEDKIQTIFLSIMLWQRWRRRKEKPWTTQFAALAAILILFRCHTWRPKNGCEGDCGQPIGKKKGKRTVSVFFIIVYGKLRRWDSRSPWCKNLWRVWVVWKVSAVLNSRWWYREIFSCHFFFSEDCPKGNPDLRVRNLFDYKLEKRKKWAHRT